jgi:hypothetical protein
MPAGAETPVSEQIDKMPAAVRPIVRAARQAVKVAAPTAMEISYRSEPPRSRSAMWKIVRYSADGTNVVGIGTFSTYATIFFYRGRELNNKAGLLQGSGKDSRFLRLHSARDAQAPAVKQLLREAFKLAGLGEEA